MSEYIEQIKKLKHQRFPFSTINAKVISEYALILKDSLCVNDLAFVLNVFFDSFVSKFMIIFLFDFYTATDYYLTMKKTTRVPYNTTLNTVLLKKLRILAAEKEKNHNDLIEEAIVDILKKYDKHVPERFT